MSADQLARALAGPAAPLLVDCSFDLADPQAGQRAYAQGHIPGAHYLHLEADLSGPVTDRSGRHPLPDRAGFASRMAGLGARPDTQVVAYDNAGGMYAARLWWLMRWLGHGAVAVLDGGLAAWRAAGLPVTAEPAPVPLPEPEECLLRESLVRTVQYDTVRANLQTGRLLLIDARAPDRFRGENETLDPVGGHIPGARNRLFRDNLDSAGRFKTPAELRQAFEALADGHAPTELVSQCGSGVTACHNLLALEIAGLSGAALYPGSWSEWCRQPGAPIATGPNP
ncbi:sulfurtransferase [Orrella sp. JC864]